MTHQPRQNKETYQLLQNVKTFKNINKYEKRNIYTREKKSKAKIIRNTQHTNLAK